MRDAVARTGGLDQLQNLFQELRLTVAAELAKTTPFKGMHDGDQEQVLGQLRLLRADLEAAEERATLRLLAEQEKHKGTMDELRGELEDAMRKLRSEINNKVTTRPPEQTGEDP